VHTTQIIVNFSSVLMQCGFSQKHAHTVVKIAVW
jgi:hypothetical protein